MIDLCNFRDKLYIAYDKFGKDAGTTKISPTHYSDIGMDTFGNIFVTGSRTFGYTYHYDKLYKIEKGLYQLKYSGVLDVISGMIVGKLPDIKRTAWKGFKEPTPKEIAMEAIKGYKFPILGEVDFGHKTVNTPMPIGLQAKMSATDLSFEILEGAVI